MGESADGDNQLSRQLWKPAVGKRHDVPIETFSYYLQSEYLQ